MWMLPLSVLRRGVSMRLLRLDRDLRRVYFAGRRVHHGLVGAGMVAVGAVLAWGDRHDFPWLPAREVEWPYPHPWI